MTGTAPAPGAHGGDGARVAAALGIPLADIVDLSASLNPVAPDPAPVVAAHLDALGRYPDPRVATEALAAAMGVDPACLLLTNGGAEAIALVGAALGGRVDEPDFSLYPAAAAHGGGPTPHSPLGTLAGPAERAGVWDEAFWPLGTGTWTRGDHLAGAVVVGSLTKLLACPGLRVGYVLCADPGLLDRLRRTQPAWALNGLAADALPDLLAPVDLPGWASAVAGLRQALVDALTARGLAVRAGVAPWVLVERSAGLRDALAPHGVVIRDCTTFGMPGTHRIAVPDQAGLDRLLAGLDAARTGRT